jgi:hypothetical protein
LPVVIRSESSVPQVVPLRRAFSPEPSGRWAGGEN